MIGLRWARCRPARLPLLVGVLLAAAGCEAGDASRIQFADVTAKAGIGFVHKSGASPEKCMVETFGSGVAWIDYDNDGFQDLFFVNGAPGSSNALYHNNRDGTFTDVTQRAGVAGTGGRTGVYKTGVAVGDFDNDGYLDLYVTAFGPNTLYRNNHDGTFSDVTSAAGVAGPPTEWSTSTGFIDVDRDGFLDLYVVNYLDYRLADNPYCGQAKEGYRMYCHPTMFDGMADRLYRNNGNGTFTDISKQAGIANPAGKGLGVAFCDYDRDGLTDIYVANDTVRNFLYRNTGKGTFVDEAYRAGVGFDANGKPQAGMGTDCADVDGNGLPDIFVTNFSEELNTLYQNRGDGIFEDVTIEGRPGLRVSSAGIRDEDVRCRQRRRPRHPRHERPRHRQRQAVSAHAHLRAEGLALRESSAAASSGTSPRRAGRRCRPTRVGRGLAVADFDNDGNLDVVISSRGPARGPVEKPGRAGRQLDHDPGEGEEEQRLRPGSDRDAARRRKAARSGRSTTSPAISAATTSACMSAWAPRRSFGRSRSLWPSGTRQVLKDVAVNQILVIDEP